MDDFSFETQVKWLDENGYLQRFIETYKEAYSEGELFRTSGLRRENILRIMPLSKEWLIIGKEMENDLTSSVDYYERTIQKFVESDLKQRRPELWI